MTPLERTSHRFFRVGTALPAPAFRYEYDPPWGVAAREKTRV